MIDSARRREVTRGILAAGAIVAVVVGLPVVLSLVGWPLPQQMPSTTEAWEWLTGPSIDNSVIVKGFALCGWTAWSYLVVMLVREILICGGLLHGRYSSTNVVQRSVAELVAAVLLLLPVTVKTFPPSYLPTAPASASVAVEFLPQSSVLASSSVASETAPIPAQGNEQSEGYVVKRYDCLSVIARDELGDESRWREIWELNRNRVFGAKRFTNPNLIYAGWTLTMPADWKSGVAVAQSSEMDMPVATTFVDEELPPQALEVPIVQQDVQEPVTTTTSPSKSESQLERMTSLPVPTPEIGAAVAGGVSTSTTMPHGAAGSTPEASEPTANAESDDGQVSSKAPVLALGSGLLAAAVLALYRRRRDNQRRHRRFGRRLRSLDSDVTPLVVGMRDEEADDDAVFLDTGLRVLFTSLETWTGSFPRILGAELSPEALTLWLAAEHDEAPEPFVAIGNRWVLDRSTPLGEPSAPASLPTLVEIGQSGSVYTLVNLEELGSISLVGDEEQAAALLRSFAVDLGTHGWADGLDLITFGLGSDLMGTGGRVVATDSMEEAAGYLEAQALVCQQELEELGVSSALEARVRCRGDVGVPVVLLADMAAVPDVELMKRLCLAAEASRAVVVVTTADQVGASHRWTLGEAGLRIADLFSVERVRAISADVLAMTSVLLADAVNSEDAPVDPDDEVDSDESLIDLRLPAEIAPTHERLWVEPAVVVGVLGRLTFEGLCRSWDMDHVNIDRELLTCLTLHPEGLSDVALKRYIWNESADRLIKDQTIMSAVSRVRGMLGASRSEQSKRLPRKSGSAYRVGPEVSTDWARFRHLIDVGAEGDFVRADRLLEALKLVRGVPFADVQLKYSWLDSTDAWVFDLGQEPRDESFPDEMIRVIQDTAKAAVDVCLQLDRLEDAHLAIDRGLLVDDGYERLIAQRMRVYAAAGDHAGVEKVFEDLVTERHRLGDSRSDLLDSTLVLYEQCRSVRRLKATS